TSAFSVSLRLLRDGEAESPSDLLLFDVSPPHARVQVAQIRVPVQRLVDHVGRASEHYGLRRAPEVLGYRYGGSWIGSDMDRNIGQRGSQPRLYLVEVLPFEACSGEDDCLG